MKTLSNHMNQRPKHSVGRCSQLVRHSALVGCVMMALWLVSQGGREEKAEIYPVMTPADHFTTGSMIKPDTAPHISKIVQSSEPLSRFAETRTAAEKRALADALIGRGTEAAIQEWGRALLAETDPDCQRAMLECLDTLNSEAAIEMITQLVEISEDPVVTLAVTRALSRLATPDTVEYLSEIYARATENPACQQRVLDVIGSIRNPAAVAGLVMVANQPELGNAFTSQAFDSLGKIGDPTCLLAMMSAYQTLLPEHFVQRHQALHAIASIQNPDSISLLQELAANATMPAIAVVAADALQNMPSGQVVVR
jgi:HEAT repeat protein